MSAALQMIDRTSDAAGAEAVIDVHDSHAIGTTIEHPQQRRDSAETRAVADAGRNRDDRHGNQAGDHARERALHAGDDDDDARGLETSVLAQHAMDARYA